MTDQSLLQICLRVTGAFEGGTPSYTDITGNFDGQGLSIGILQWNAGQGTLQQLLLEIGTNMGWDKAQSFFTSDIHNLAVLKPADAIGWCVDHYLTEGSTSVDPAAKEKWQEFLQQPESVAAQIAMATKGPLFRAKTLVQNFCPTFANRLRPYGFFFDLVTQEGGMQTHSGKVVPWTDAAAPDNTEALGVAETNSPKSAGIWETVIQQEADGLANLLIYYAYQRAKLANPTYLWDTFSRRGCIATRGGIVHATKIDLTQVLD